MDFKEKLQKTLNQGVEASKEIIHKAKEGAKDLGDLGVLKFEISQLEGKLNKLHQEIGETVDTLLLVDGKQSVTLKTAGIKELLDEVGTIKEKIENKNKILEERKDKKED